VERENTLKALYHVIEARDFKGEGVSMEELAARRRETLDEARDRVQELRRHGLATYDSAGEATYLTPEGWQRAKAIVRNHRLWELYLTSEANIAADHVHDDAEEIEHVLGEAVVLQLEKGLHYATRDPHGKVIPSSAEIHQPDTGRSHEEAVGYGKRS
jgi:manganese/zinc/iron transport system permease protein